MRTGRSLPSSSDGSPARTASTTAIGIGEQPPQREAQRVRARVVEPVRVVDEHERRRDLRLRGEQAQGRRADGEAVAAAARPQRQRPAERRRLGPRNPRELAERRAQQLQQAGERHRRLGLHAARAQHPHPVGAPGDGVEQRGLADADLPDEGEDAARARPCVGDEAIEPALLGVAAQQHRAIMTRWAP